MDEAGVGITAFLSTAPGFSGLFKLRFADFIVREVEPDGTVVRLRTPAHKGQVPAAAGVVSEESEARAALQQAVPAEELKALEALSRELDEHPRADAPPMLLHIGTDKATRTAVHKAIRAIFPLFSSETTEDGQAIRIATKKSARREEQASRRAEPSGKRGV
jgi:tRNA pseudouridine13 synthase